MHAFSTEAQNIPPSSPKVWAAAGSSPGSWGSSPGGWSGTGALTAMTSHWASPGAKRPTGAAQFPVTFDQSPTSPVAGGASGSPAVPHQVYSSPGI